MEEIKLKAQKRESATKGELNQARKAGRVPGIYYAKGGDPVHFYTSEITLKPLVFTSETHIIMLEVEGMEAKRAIIKDVQFDPVSDRVVHFDLQGVTVGEKLTVQVPILFTGRAEGLKQGGIFQSPIHKLDVECLPKDIPQHLEIDITHLSLNDSIFVKDLNFPDLKILNNEDVLVATVQLPRGAVEETTEDLLSDEPQQPELIKKGKSGEDEE
ncbi:MAG: 50S ribosomal protein L25 [Ignavibacteriales bacterium]|nr:50S ribosomal protein L25 [Ignavibacteriales bacterium]MCF8317058.1 50S ribosomal protein L25 [Ignavibacteriales bacterium]MCF8438415.1 50S ribosomal protein L25 [Ignavibacteriales bacterium]